MKLLTKEIKDRLPEWRSTEGQEDPMIVAKFFAPMSNWTWYVIEGRPYAGTWEFFGLVFGHYEELGYFTLQELESVTLPLGLKVERDIHWKPKPISQVWDGWESIKPKSPEEEFYLDIGWEQEDIDSGRAERETTIWKTHVMSLNVHELIDIFADLRVHHNPRFSSEVIADVRKVLYSLGLSVEDWFEIVKDMHEIYYRRVVDHHWFALRDTVP